MRDLSFLLRLVILGVCLLVTQFVSAQPFNNPLPIPPKATGSTFDLHVQVSQHNFNPNQPTPTGAGADTINFDVPVRTFCYNLPGSNAMSYLGPTMQWPIGQTLNVNIHNDLNESTTTHWHGINLPAAMDGGPQEVIPVGTVWRPRFKLIDSVQTAWYHSHLMDSTTEQVILGQAGMIMVEDTANDPLRAVLPHTYGVNDLPIVIQEKGFVTGPKVNGVRQVTALKVSNKPGNGPYTLVNGMMNAYQRVPRQFVRLRMLNGSPRKTFYVGVSTSLRPASAQLDPMWLVATDGGYVPQPFQMDSALIAPGERMEFLVDFSQYANGDTVYLSNLSRSLPFDYIGFNEVTGGPAMMAFVVDNSLNPSAAVTQLPLALKPYTVDTTDVFRYRYKVLNGGLNGKHWTIDGDTMNMEIINDTILVNTTEVWTIKNNTRIAHPFHIHKVQFQVIRYIVPIGNDTSVKVTYTYPNLPPYLMGYKDDVIVRGGGLMQFVARFDSFPTVGTHHGDLDPMEAFMYHCHILPHEDFSMMHQFVVLDSATYTLVSGVPDPISGGPFQVFPNPASDELILRGEAPSPGMLRFTDMMGRLVHSEPLYPFAGEHTIRIADLPRGLLLLEWTSNGERYTQKLLLK
ncbi:MAG: multicopper oxidase domain-containing protein [Bacteroidia bacterium]|nr:multicopper oxidase domain-containing protein [Bacteroidia bacterium]